MFQRVIYKFQSILRKEPNISSKRMSNQNLATLRLCEKKTALR